LQRSRQLRHDGHDKHHHHNKANPNPNPSNHNNNNNDNNNNRNHKKDKNDKNDKNHKNDKNDKHFNWLNKRTEAIKGNDKSKSPSKPLLILPKVDVKKVINIYNNVSHQVGAKAIVASKVSLKVALLYASIITVRWLLIKTISFVKENQASVKGLKFFKNTRRAAWKTRYWISNQANYLKKVFMQLFNKKKNDNNNDNDKIVDNKDNNNYNNDDDNNTENNPEERNKNNSVMDYEQIEKEQEEIWQSLGYLLNTTKSQHDDIRKSITELAEKQQLGQQHIIETIELIENKNKVSQNSMIEATFDEMQLIRTDFDNKIGELREQISKDIAKIVEQQTMNEAAMLNKLKQFVDSVKRLDLGKKS